MADETEEQINAETNEPQLERSTYEIIRNRLRGHADELRSRMGKLNNIRRDVFGSIETKLIETARITTAHNCVPRDMVPVGDKFVFGYNVHMGLKTETAMEDVFCHPAFRRAHLPRGKPGNAGAGQARP